MRYLSIFFVLFFIHPLYAQSTEQYKPIEVVDGVSLELAQYRKKVISDIKYAFDISVPKNHEEALNVRQKITFHLNNLSNDIQLDFKEDQSKLNEINVNGHWHPLNHYNEHIVIDKNNLVLGENIIELKYLAGDSALNRNGDFLYTLFVPDRMRTSFVVFDQPNLKATFDLTLIIPETYEAISSAPLRKRVDRRDRSVLYFEQSNKISTYLFSFVAGHFNSVVRNIDGLEMTMLHRETNEEKIIKNVDEIFRLHKASIDYMEEYTDIKFPFKKFGFALIPSFQFGGMEHVGAIQYKASSIMLDGEPPQTELLSRAALIGHETAHMWFGDLVTMDWFNDVWTKEVFANFMSAKIVNPSFPDIDHALQTQLRLQPAAYSVDRTEGPNPIRQDLPNLNEAGTMYGAIIYNKAPIMMQQLELLVGEDNFRDGMREYLQKYAFGNATWPDLIAVLNKKSEMDLISWSDTWVNTPGRPIFNFMENGNEGLLSQDDPLMLNRHWPQYFTIKDGNNIFDVSYNSDPVPVGIENNSLLINANGTGYGLFPIDKSIIKDKWQSLTDLEKATSFVNLYEQLLEGNGVISPKDYIDIIIWTIKRETNPLIINHLMRQLSSVYWSLFNPHDRINIAATVEEALLTEVNNKDLSAGLRKIYFRKFFDIVLSSDGLAFLDNVWDGGQKIDGLELTEGDLTEIAAQLAIKLPDSATEIIERQRSRIKNKDMLNRFDYLRGALYSDIKTRDTFFELLKDEQYRRTEEWVVTALTYFHHPLRHGQSEQYILPSLELLQEIQITGDIFFPGRWLNSTLEFYQSDSAVQIVRNFLKERPNYNKQLRLKILQEADPLFRANKILKKQEYPTARNNL